MREFWKRLSKRCERGEGRKSQNSCVVIEYSILPRATSLCFSVVIFEGFHGLRNHTGGGKIGYYLARSLINNDYEVLLMEKDPGAYRRLAADLGDVVMHGDGCDPLILRDAGIERADLLVAATGDDADNLITCQMAAHCFGRTRIIARVNNPDNEALFEKLGVHERVSGTATVLNLIDRKVERSPLHLLGMLEQSNVEAVEIVLSAGSRLVGRTPDQVTLPKETLIVSVLRNCHPMLPDPDSVFEAGDIVIVLVPPQMEAVLRAFVE
jgi:trk system potassium uptake protein TrkA